MQVQQRFTHTVNYGCVEAGRPAASFSAVWWRNCLLVKTQRWRRGDGGYSAGQAGAFSSELPLNRPTDRWPAVLSLPGRPPSHPDPTRAAGHRPTAAVRPSDRNHTLVRRSVGRSLKA